MTTKNILTITSVLVLVFFIMIGTMYKAEQNRQTAAELDREIRWEQTHQVIVPRP